METSLELGDILPARHLRALRGGPTVDVGQNHRRAQVLVLTHPEPCEACADYLTSLQEIAGVIGSEGGEAVAILGPGWQDQAGTVLLPAVVDDGSLSSLLSPAGEPVLAIADRFGQLFAYVEAGGDHQFPSHQQVLTSLLDIGIGCPECGVPDVPCPAVLPDWDATSGGIRLLQ